MREKPANEKAVERMIMFLISLKQKEDVSIYKLAKDNHVSFYATEACLQNDIVKWMNINKGLILLGDSYSSSRKTALLILDYILHKRKKTVTNPISDEWRGINESLSTISERLMVVISQQERLLKSPKNDTSSNQDASQKNVFEEQQQRERDRLQLAGSIASGVYKSVHVCNHVMGLVDAGDGKNVSLDLERCVRCGYMPSSGEHPYEYQAINNYIVSATDDLLKKLYGENTSEGNLKCSVCDKRIMAGDPHSRDLDTNKYFCDKHTALNLIKDADNI